MTAKILHISFEYSVEDLDGKGLMPHLEELAEKLKELKLFTTQRFLNMETQENIYTNTSTIHINFSDRKSANMIQPQHPVPCPMFDGCESPWTCSEINLCLEYISLRKKERSNDATA